MYHKGPACSGCPEGTECSSRYPGLCSGNPTEPLTLKPPLFPWEVPDWFPTSNPDASKPLVTDVEFIDISDHPDAIIEHVFIPPPNVTKGSCLSNSDTSQISLHFLLSALDGDRCIYTCKRNKGCSVKIETNRLIDGAVSGSCFPPSFGGSCSGTPKDCVKCSDMCTENHGRLVTVTLDKSGTL